MKHQIKISEDDFRQVKKVLEVIMDDIDLLLTKDNFLNLIISEDGTITYNFRELDFKLTEQKRTLRFIFNLYFFCKKNSYLFTPNWLERRTVDEAWYKEFKEIVEEIKNRTKGGSK